MIIEELLEEKNSAKPLNEKQKNVNKFVVVSVDNKDLKKGKTEYGKTLTSADRNTPDTNVIIKYKPKE